MAKALANTPTPLRSCRSGLCSAYTLGIVRATSLWEVRQHYSDFYDNSLTESGRNAIIEVSAVAEKYGQRPSTLIKGDPFDLQLDLMTARAHWQYQAEEREKQKAKS